MTNFWGRVAVSNDGKESGDALPGQVWCSIAFGASEVDEGLRRTPMPQPASVGCWKVRSAPPSGRILLRAV